MTRPESLRQITAQQNQDSEQKVVQVDQRLTVVGPGGRARAVPTATEIENAARRVLDEQRGEIKTLPSSVQEIAREELQRAEDNIQNMLLDISPRQVQVALGRLVQTVDMLRPLSPMRISRDDEELYPTYY